MKIICLTETWAVKGSLVHLKVEVYGPNIRIVLCGDFNIDSYKHNREFTRFLDTLSDFGLYPIIKWPTRIGQKSLSTIDQVFLNFKCCGANCVIDNTLSDHRTVLFELTTLCGKNLGHEIYYSRRYDDSSIHNFTCGLVSENWLEIYNLNCIDTAFEYFLNLFLFHFNMHFPIIKRFRRPNMNKWVTDEVVTSSKELKNLFSLAKVLPEKKNDYLRAKKMHQRLVVIAKKTYYQNKISQSQNINKTTWSIVSELTQKRKMSLTFP
nr:unnamed protein product [Callosobruchus analis]